MSPEKGQCSSFLQLDTLNVADIVVHNSSFSSLCVEDGYLTTQENNEIDADDNFSLALDSDVSRSSETTSSKDSVSSEFFNSPQKGNQDPANQFEIGIFSFR